MKNRTDIYEKMMSAMSPEDRAEVIRGENIAAAMLAAGAACMNGNLTGPDILNAIGNIIAFAFGQFAESVGPTAAMEEFEHFLTYQRQHMTQVMATFAEGKPS